jgi:hypothetical protein
MARGTLTVPRAQSRGGASKTGEFSTYGRDGDREPVEIFAALLGREHDLFESWL